MGSLARAQGLADLGRPAEARAELARYLATEPHSVAALCLLARCELELGDPAATLRATESALAVAPESEWALRLRALALSTQSRHRDAVATADAAVRVDPHDWTNHYVLAQVLLAAADSRQGAYEAARRAVELAPHEAQAHVVLGMAASALKRKAEERAAYEEALRLNPESAIALNNLAAMDIDSARLGRAARNVTAGLSLSPSEEILQRNLDAVALRLMVRLMNVVLLTGFLPLVLVLAATDNAWWARATVGVVQLCTYALVAWLTLRYLPPGARRHLRGLPRRMTGGQRFYAGVLVVLVLALMVTAFAPGSLWVAGAGVIAVIIQMFQVLLVIWIVRAAVGWLRRRFRYRGRG